MATAPLPAVAAAACPAPNPIIFLGIRSAVKVTAVPVPGSTLLQKDAISEIS